MKGVILAGGYGTRISEESSVRPKPMVEIGGQADPVAHHEDLFGVRRWTTSSSVRLQGRVIKEYFADYALQRSDVTFDLREAR